MPDLQQFQNEDLLLSVSKSVDPARFDINQYEPFIDRLCGTREYQKDAIRTVLRYFLGGRYTSLRHLAEENFNANNYLQDRYGTFHEMERHLQIPDKLSCSVDLATATGKSYVIYGVARIMLAHGAVDRVLVLCPSRTIESSLTEKFRFLSAETELRSLLPENSRVRNPHIINATETLVDGTICVENFHATLVNVKSSIRDSLRDKGARTLVLNDEVHHVYNPTGKELKRWKEFLLDPEFGFTYIAGFSGTCYLSDEYFADVVARYSLRQAIEQGYAKTIDYVAEDTSTSQEEKFQKIYDNHLNNKNYYYRKVKPLTILVTRDIADCKRLTEDLTAFLARQENVPIEVAAKKVLIVTSDKKHQANVRVLKEVDRQENPVEWITSVSMLTEGWDVQNVFQIVPHEERAFNSKLLIAQVLGRGLRIPDAYRGERIAVTVFNHDTWSSRIKYLVDEVMEIEKRLYSYPVGKQTNYNFTLHHIDYDPVEEVASFEQQGEYEYTKGYVSLMPQKKELERETIYMRATTGTQREKKTLVRYQMHSIDNVAEHIHSKFRAIDTEKKTNYAERYGVEWLRNLIRNSLNRIGESEDQVSEENRQRLQKAFGVVHREAAQVVRRQMKPNALVVLTTAVRPRNSIALGALRRSEATIVYDEYSRALSDDETQVAFQRALDDETLPRSAFHEVTNSFHFKTSLNMAFANHKPERIFLRSLTRPENATVIDAWMKSTDQDFYEIEYSWRKGEHARRGFFNPDFFIKQGTHIWVIEIKEDDEINDPSPENKGKYRAAKLHFKTLNELQSETVYHFHFLAPSDYDMFFQALRDGKNTFVTSGLDVVLAEN